MARGSGARRRATPDALRQACAVGSMAGVWRGAVMDLHSPLAVLDLAAMPAVLWTIDMVLDRRRSRRWAREAAARPRQWAQEHARRDMVRHIREGVREARMTEEERERRRRWQAEEVEIRREAWRRLGLPEGEHACTTAAREWCQAPPP